MYFEKFQWLPWQRELKIDQKQRKNGHFCNFVWHLIKCDLPPINIPQGISMVVKNFLCLFLINSCQFYMIRIFWSLKYIPLTMTIPQMWRITTIWFQMSHFIRSVSDNGKCGIILKLPTVGVHLCVFWKFSVVAMATGAKNYSTTEENGLFCNFVWYLSAIYSQSI